ncbi:eukaryotic translation initiation factor 4E-binding protein 3-like [Salvelinus sp. IW2-2015]|uniref:eukaryotic translation initiation factor 4E-binding protein 3-like n=1 Tax=Salvelinus sp. IW2-2015 TaxID=2691554 RepID=UPI000CDFAE3F|nr:eukaryotic translation initiation factor 4E-binding protein 3-like [Salvelinus alpinus]
MTTNAQEAKSCPIPTRVLTLKDWSQLPDCYSQTPGGTLFSTTPGGTRIIYDRKFLLDCRNSPIARTPPCCLPQIPGVTVPALHPLGKLQELKEELEEEEKDLGDDSQFEMEHLSALIASCGENCFIFYSDV